MHGLKKIYEKYKDQGLVILGMPSNDFGSQETGSNTEIAQFCELNYGITFPMASKEVVSGDAAHPFSNKRFSLLATIKMVKINALILQGTPEFFDENVVHPTSFTVHRDLNFVIFEGGYEGKTRELRPPYLWAVILFNPLTTMLSFSL